MKRLNNSPISRDIRENIKKDPEYAREFYEAISDESLPVQMALIRRVSGISQEDVASRLHVKQTHVSRLERTGSDHLLSTYEKMAKILRSKIVIVPKHFKIVPA